MKLRAPSTPLLLLLLAPVTACVLTHRLGDQDTDADDPTATSAVDDDTGGDAINVIDAAERMARARCGAFFVCGCDEGVSLAWPDLDACIEALEAAAQERLDEGTQNGFTFDPECARRFTSYYGDQVCGDADDASEAALAAALGCGLFDAPLAVGAPCSPADPLLPAVRTCAVGLVCVDEHCTPLGVSGSACGRAEDCAAGLVCDRSSSPPTCAPLRANGDACDDDSQCAIGSFCAADVCAPKAAPGEACTDAFGCLHGFCNTEGIEFVCEARMAACDPSEVVVQSSCDDARAALQSFIMSNRGCNDAGDCIERAAPCHDQAQCGSVAVAADADLDALDAALALVEQQCQGCSADPCGGALVCDAGSCGVSF